MKSTADQYCYVYFCMFEEPAMFKPFSYSSAFVTRGAHVKNLFGRAGGGVATLDRLYTKTILRKHNATHQTYISILIVDFPYFHALCFPQSLLLRQSHS